MLKRLFLTIMLLLMFASFAFADFGDKATLGGQDSSGNYHWRVDSSGHLIPGTTAQNNFGDATHYINNAYITTQNVTTTNIAGDILPTTSHTRDIGSATYEISGIYADGATVDSLTAITATITTANLTNTSIAGDILPTTSHSRDIGSSTYEISGIYADGATVDVLTVTDVTGDILPLTTHTTDIGSSTYEISGVYADGASLDSLTMAATGNMRVPYEVFTTGDTLTALDSGRYLITYLNDSDGIIDFTLPAVAAGLEMKFATGLASIIRIDPNGTDVIQYSGCIAGDRIGSGTAAAADGASGDSITLVSDGTRWYVVEMNPDDGSWADAN